MATTTYYCRGCGFVIEAGVRPPMCAQCGNILSDNEGFGTSGDSTGVQSAITGAGKPNLSLNFIQDQVR